MTKQSTSSVDRSSTKEKLMMTVISTTIQSCPLIKISSIQMPVLYACVFSTFGTDTTDVCWFRTSHALQMDMPTTAPLPPRKSLWSRSTLIIRKVARFPFRHRQHQGHISTCINPLSFVCSSTKANQQRVIFLSNQKGDWISFHTWVMEIIQQFTAK